MPEQKSERSTEHYGMGQSGYTAGRLEGDPSLKFEARNISFPRGKDEATIADDGDDDERFVGAGGVAWVPEGADADWPPNAAVPAKKPAGT